GRRGLARRAARARPVRERRPARRRLTRRVWRDARLCRQAALLAPTLRPQSRPYACIWPLPASLPRNDHRTLPTSDVRQTLLEPLEQPGVHFGHAMLDQRQVAVVGAEVGLD